MEERALAQCRCGCNVYRPQEATDSNLTAFQPIPGTPTTTLLELTYEDDTELSDDHEYISIKITELAEMLARINNCNCATDD